MREDISKVVIERPRRGHSLPSSKTGLRVRRYDPDKEYDDSPKRVSGSRSKHIRAEEIKYFSDLLGPLRRFLRKNVGRPWDLVYSEMKREPSANKVDTCNASNPLKGPGRMRFRFSWALLFHKQSCYFPS